MNRPSPILLRHATEADVPVLRALYRRTIETVNTRDYTPAQIAAWAGTSDRTDSLRARLATQHFLVATRDDEIVGFASIDLGQSYLDLLYVSADHQRMGIGRLLGEAILDAAREAGLTRVEVDASVTARPLFEALGFTYIADGFPEIDGVELKNFQMALDLHLAVRPMVLADLAAVEALDMEVFGGDGFGPYTWRQLFDLHGSTMFVVEPSGGSRALSGFAVGAIGQDGVGWFLALGVAPAARGLGLGRALVERTLRKLDARVAVIRLTVSPSNTAARALYASVGFEDLGTEANYYGTGRDRLVMIRGPSAGAAGPSSPYDS